MKIRLHTGCCLLVWAQPFLPFVEIDVEEPFFVTSDNVGQKRLMLLMRRAMMGEQRSTDGNTLILVVLSQNVQHPSSQLLDFTHGLQMLDDCCMVTTHPSHWPILELFYGDPHGLKHSEDPHQSWMATPSVECHSCQNFLA
jgi:hypothetical protein